MLAFILLISPNCQGREIVEMSARYILVSDIIWKSDITSTQANKLIYYL